jgi:hypothetical protein
VQSGIIQPDNVSLIVGELSVSGIVRSDVVWLNVVVDNRMRVMRVSLVHVIWSKRRRKGDVGGQYQADNCSAK